MLEIQSLEYKTILARPFSAIEYMQVPGPSSYMLKSQVPAIEHMQVPVSICKSQVPAIEYMWVSSPEAKWPFGMTLPAVYLSIADSHIHT